MSSRIWIRVGVMALLVGALILLGVEAADACPSCGLEMVEKQKGGADLAQGFTYSMIGMASAPFLVFASVAVYVVRTYRRRRLADGETGEDAGIQ